MLPRMALRCVVCDGAVNGEPVYADAWERSRKRSPCCTPACADRFDPDVHWIPATLPAPAAGDERVRLRTLARQRLAALDLPRPVVRELLLAGLAPDVLRPLVAESRAASAAARGHNRMNLLRWLLRGRIRQEHPDHRADRAYVDADADLDQWEAVVATRAPR